MDLIDKNVVTKAVLDKRIETFVVHESFLTLDSMTIPPA